MPAKTKPENRALAFDHLSTKAAQSVLAAETRAFGNKAAKLNLQTATAAFAHAKQVQQQAKTSQDTKQDRK
jgi:hypothetical protein